jgi:hypothetical protein
MFCKRISTVLALAPTLALAQDYDVGAAALETGDYATARQNWLALAEDGHADAQYGMGWLRDLGKGMPEDNTEAVRWYRLAAEQGQLSAQYSLGLMLSTGEGVPQDKAEAARWYDLAALQGSLDAQ